jgi:two-component sensor histidine kinase
MDALPVQPPRTRQLKLVVSELVINSIEHGRLHPHEQIEVSARVDRHGALRMEVRDPGPGPSGDAICGMGWKVLERVADRWGFDRSDGVARVWFELDATR